MISDATALAFKPDGQQVAVATMNGHITFFNPTTGQFKIESQKNVQIQCNLDLVALNFVTICGLVTILQRPFFNLLHKII